MTEERGSFRPLMDSLGGLLSNPVVLEGLIAGITAISASRKTKISGGADASPVGGILDMLPGILPLLSVLTGPGGGGNTPEDTPVLAGADTSDGGDDALSAFADESDSSDTVGEEASGDDAPPFFGEDAVGGAFGGVEVSYESRASQRENLLLAIRPFLSDSRRSAADAMVQVNKLSGLFRQR